jgi:hypothetical protein
VINLEANEVFKNEEGYVVLNGNPDHERTSIILQMKEGGPAPARAKSKTEANRILREHGLVGPTTALETWSFPDRATNEYHLAEVFVMQLPQQGRSRKKVKSAKKQKSKAGKRAVPKGKRGSRQVRRRSK